MMNNLTPSQTLSIRLSSDQNAVFSAAPDCLLQVDGTVQTNANQAECLKSKGRLHHFTWCATPQNSQWYLQWGWWYKSIQFWKTLPAVFT